MRSKTKNKLHWALRARPKEFEAWKKEVARQIRVETIERLEDWKALASKAGVTYKTCCNFLDYSTKLPHAYTIWRLANALGLKIFLGNGK